MFMEDGMDSFHVPQQSRRHKLRIIHQNNEQPPPSPTFQLISSGYNPSSLPSPHTLTAAAAAVSNYPNFHDLNHHRRNHSTAPHPKLNPEPSRTYINSSSSPSSLSPNPNSIHHHFHYSTDQYLPCQTFNGGGGDDDDDDVRVVSPFLHGQGLSLSLSSSQQYCYSHNQLNSQFDRANVLPRSANYNETLRSPVPLGPFTGYASILNRSRFLKPAQQVLDDFCGVDRDMNMMMTTTTTMINSPLEEESLNEDKDPITCSDRVEHPWENSRLVLLLEEVYKRYKIYCQQMQSVVTSFEAVPGLENAAPCISFAFKSMAKHFTCLKNAILDQIQFMSRTNLGYAEGLRKEETSLLRTGGGQGHQDKKPVHNSVFPCPPVWRSQRGLPDHAVAVLKKWLFEHFLHPYPTDLDKQLLAHQTGLSRNQVSNWFINARVRLWKPMVEEIHMLETRQDQRISESSEIEKPNANQPIDHVQSTNPFPLGEPFQIRPTQNSQYVEPKCSGHELLPPHTSRLSEDLINLSHKNYSTIHLAGVSRSRAEESSSVSLGLGLYQNNNGIELSVPFPSNNIAQHFGLETDTKMYMRNSYEA